MTAQTVTGVDLARDRVAAWCGWVMVAAAVLIPPLAWLCQLAFAPLLALMGLLCLPAVHIEDEDRPMLIVLLGALVWAAASSTWSPYQPRGLERNTLLQIALSVPLFWSAVCGARRAEPRLNALALRILAWGLALFAAVLLADVVVNGRIYQALHQTFYQPMQLDIAQNALAHAITVLAVLWPAVLVGGLRRRLDLIPLGLAVAAAILGGHLFRGDSPVFAAPLSAVVILAVWRWPSGGPRWLAAKIALASLAMPGLVWAVRASGRYVRLEHVAPPSWAVRMSYWSHAIDWIADRPVRGWGFDASRAMGPGIQLHPHNAALQIWLELGLVGAVAAAAFWALSLTRLSRRSPDLAMAGVAGSAVAFVFIAWLNYGAWQGWWLAVGGLVPVLAAMLANREPKAKSTRAPISR